MSRLARVVEAAVPHHVTQRGVDGQRVFFSYADREVYLNLVAANLADARVEVLAYCLMRNHVHWVVQPETIDSLAVLFRRVHGRYAQYLNARRGRTGHLWQNRYFSCPVSRGHLWSALRYVELNPVRAGAVEDPGAYRWSSAAAHLAGRGSAEGGVPLDWEIWDEAGEATGWRDLLGTKLTLDEVTGIRRCTYSGKPLGDEEFVARMEVAYGRRWRKQGRPAKAEKGTEPTGVSSAGG
jgi:putative transposase